MTVLGPSLDGAPPLDLSSGLARQVVKRRAPELVAAPITAAEDVTLADGRVIHAALGDMRLTRETLTIDVVPAERFFREYEPVRSGSLLLSVEDCAELEKTLGLAATRSPAECINAVARLATLRIGDVRLDFTPGQLAELRHRAQKRGHTLAEEINAVVNRIHDEIFHHGG